MAAKRYHAYSKMATDVIYDEYTPGPDLPIKVHSVTIKGGAGIANKNIITPLGIHTEISERDMESLNKNGIFKLHKENGFITVESKNVPVEKVIGNLTAEADPSGPIVPSDYDEKSKGPKPMGLSD